MIKVYGEVGEDGFYVAENGAGERGLVPSNFVEEVVHTEDGGAGAADNYEVC